MDSYLELKSITIIVYFDARLFQTWPVGVSLDWLLWRTALKNVNFQVCHSPIEVSWAFWKKLLEWFWCSVEFGISPTRPIFFKCVPHRTSPFLPATWTDKWPGHFHAGFLGQSFFFNKDSYSLKSNKNSKFENHWIRWPPFQAQHFSHWDIASSLSSSDPHPFLLLSRWQYWDRQMSPHHINKEAPWCSLNLAGLGLWFFCWWKLIKLFASSEYHTGSQAPRTPGLSESLVGLITHGLGFLRPPH